MTSYCSDPLLLEVVNNSGVEKNLKNFYSPEKRKKIRVGGVAADRRTGEKMKGR